MICDKFYIKTWLNICYNIVEEKTKARCNLASGSVQNLQSSATFTRYGHYFSALVVADKGHDNRRNERI